MRICNENLINLIYFVTITIQTEKINRFMHDKMNEIPNNIINKYNKERNKTKNINQINETNK